MSDRLLIAVLLAAIVLLLLAACAVIVIGVTNLVIPATPPQPVTPGPTFVIHTERYDCTTIWLNGAWTWPPICQPNEEAK